MREVGRLIEAIEGKENIEERGWKERGLRVEGEGRGE